MNKFKLLLASSIFAISGAVSAMPIVGEVAFTSETGSSWSAVDAFNADTTVAASTGVKFSPSVTTGFWGHVTNANGTFAGTENTEAEFFDFQFNPLVAGSTLWTFDTGMTTYSLTMNAVNTVLKGDTTLTVEGSGLLSVTGYDDTYGSWDFSGNRFSWSASAAPEPAMVLLLATGLIGFGFARKARKA